MKYEKVEDIVRKIEKSQKITTDSKNILYKNKEKDKKENNFKEYLDQAIDDLNKDEEIEL